MYVIDLKILTWIPSRVLNSIAIQNSLEILPKSGWDRPIGSSLAWTYPQNKENH